MRLIDADVLKDEMRAGCVPIDLGGITGITGDNDSIGDYIDAAPTIDAIPVEWIMKWSNKRYRETHRDVSVVDVLAAWQKEQEAQDGKA